MNILSDLTRHIILASRNLKIEPKSAPFTVPPSMDLSEGKTLQIMSPTPIQEAFQQSPMIQNAGIKPLSLESMVQPSSTMPSPPVPSFNLGNIEGFAEDPSVSMIVCDGPMKPIKIKRNGQLEQTSIVLGRPEIDYVVNLFSRKSNIPLKPVFRANMDNLSILALVSSMESRFMLTVNH